MVLLKSTVLLLLISAFEDANSIQPTCSSDCVSDQSREGTQVNYYCQIQSTGGNKPALTWKYKLLETEVKDVPAQQQSGNTIKRDFSFELSKPVPEVFCADGEGEKCIVKSCNILYSPKLVVTIPPLLASPDEKITCTSDGNPEPESFKWQESVDGSWTDVPGANDKTYTAELKDGATYTELRCVATNSIGSGNSVPLAVSHNVGGAESEGESKKGGVAPSHPSIIGGVVAVVILGFAVIMIGE